MRFPVLLITASLDIIHTHDMSKFDRILQTLTNRHAGLDFISRSHHLFPEVEQVYYEMSKFDRILTFRPVVTLFFNISARKKIYAPPGALSINCENLVTIRSLVSEEYAE